MNIVIVGAGAMGCLFGAYLARAHTVTLLDPNREKLAHIHDQGLTVLEPTGETLRVSVRAAHPDQAAELGQAELVLVFVKAMHTRAALEGARPLLGPDTWLMTLQNGMGHQAVLTQFALPEQVILGTTQHNGSLVSHGVVRHGGGGSTYIGPLQGDGGRLADAAAAFQAGGIPTEVSENVTGMIWRKLFLNASASVLTALLHCPLGTIMDDPAAWSAACGLIEEAVAVANAQGQQFDAETVKAEVLAQLARSRGGYTSIYADLNAGRPTEVDSISGAVAAEARRLGLSAPKSEMAVQLIHAMERNGHRHGNGI